MLEASIGIKNSWKYEKDLIQLLNTFLIKKYIIQLGYFFIKLFPIWGIVVAECKLLLKICGCVQVFSSHPEFISGADKWAEGNFYQLFVWRKGFTSVRC